MFATNHLVRVRPLFAPQEHGDDDDEGSGEKVGETEAPEKEFPGGGRRGQFAGDRDDRTRRARSQTRPVPYQLAVSSFVPRQRRPQRAGSSTLGVANCSSAASDVGGAKLNKTVAIVGTTAPPLSHIIGKFQELKGLSHPNICEYVEIVKGKHDRVILIAEHYKTSLLDVMQKRGSAVGPERLCDIRKHAHDILAALAFLCDRGIVHRNLSARNCLLDEKGIVKLSEFGLYHLTEGGIDVDFPIGSPTYMAPETVLSWNQDTDKTLSNGFCKSDVWSLGIILAELYIGGPFWKPRVGVKLERLLRAIAELAVLSMSSPASDQIPKWTVGERNHGIWDMLSEPALRFLRGDNLCSTGVLEECLHFREFVLDCLEPDFRKRPLPKQALCHRFLASKCDPTVQVWTKKPYLASTSLALNTGGGEPLSHSSSGTTSDIDEERLSDLLFESPPAYLYYFWRLAGGDVELELAKRGALLTTPPVCRAPRLVRVAEAADHQAVPRSRDGAAEGGVMMTGVAESLFSATTTVLSLKEVKQRYEEAVNIGNDGQRAKPAGPSKAAEPINWDTDYFSLTDPDEISFITGNPKNQPWQLDNSGRGPPSSMSDTDYQFVDGDSVPSDFPDKLYDAPALPDTNGNDDCDALSMPLAPASAHAATSLSNTALLSSAGSSTQSMNKKSAPFASTPPPVSAAADTTPEPANNVTVPLLMREKSIVYQCRRVRLFRELLSQYPASRDEIIYHAKVDVPPLLRGLIWAAVLGVTGDYRAAYRDLDKDSETATDRQIELDVPRCHQYHPLMSSPAGHAKLKRLLKCWVSANEKLVYWQGLDSLCAPFLTLNFNSDALAFACLQRFIPRFLRNFFLYDNSHVIQEYLAVFRHLLSFHDPELSSHLDNIQFNPELYAIPWFLTLFTHVFPLDKIYHLWDKILVGPSSLPLFAGIAILRQIRGVLLQSEFNECILLFSESFPEVDIEKCIGSALEMCRVTPPSVVHRVHCPNSEDYRSPLSACGIEAHIQADAPQSAGARWWDQPVPIETKKLELAPRISLADYVLLGVRPLVLDVRSESEFERGHLQYSVNVQQVNLQGLLPAIRRCKKKYHVVVADRGSLGPEMATELVRAFLPRVAVLTGGVDAVRLDGNSLDVPGATGNRCALCSCSAVRKSVAGRTPLPAYPASSRGADIGRAQFLQCSLSAPLA